MSARDEAQRGLSLEELTKVLGTPITGFCPIHLRDSSQYNALSSRAYPYFNGVFLGGSSWDMDKLREYEWERSLPGWINIKEKTYQELHTWIHTQEDPEANERTITLFQQVRTNTPLLSHQEVVLTQTNEGIKAQLHSRDMHPFRHDIDTIEIHTEWTEVPGQETVSIMLFTGGGSQREYTHIEVKEEIFYVNGQPAGDLVEGEDALFHRLDAENTVVMAEDDDYYIIQFSNAEARTGTLQTQEVTTLAIPRITCGQMIGNLYMNRPLVELIVVTQDTKTKRNPSW